MTTSTTNGAQPPFTITGQTEVQGQNANGVYVDGMKVSFTTKDGFVGSVWLPMPAYNAQNVAQAIVDKINTVASINALSS